MRGLKVIADTLEGKAQSRAVTAHAAGVGVASASSFAIAGLIANLFGNQAAFSFGGICALIAIAVALSVKPSKSPVLAQSSNPRALLDFRPVFRNRAAMARIAGYTFHTWEMAGLRAWGVTFLLIAEAKAGASAWLPAPTLLFTLAGFASIVVSVSGVGSSAVLAAVLVIAWLAFIFLDSSALTAGTVQAADPRTARRHHGSTQHVRLRQRVHRPARRWAGTGPRREEFRPRLGPRVRPTCDCFARRSGVRPSAGITADMPFMPKIPR
jgi:hypothetical protein